jgi:hypothetical protein
MAKYGLENFQNDLKARQNAHLKNALNESYTDIAHMGPNWTNKFLQVICQKKLVLFKVSCQCLCW